MSTTVEVFPTTLTNNTPFQEYRAISNPTDIANVHYHAGDIENITERVTGLKDPEGLGVFQLTTTLKGGNFGAEGIQLFHYSIGPIEIKLSYDSASEGISLQVFLNLPIIPAIQVLNISGSLKDGVEGTLGYPGILSGSVSVKKQGNKYILTYSATVVGKLFSGSIPLPI